MTFDTVITDSHVVTPTGIIEKNIIIDEGKIVKLTNEIPSCNSKINGTGLVSIPGLIDTHIHYGVYSSIDKSAITESHVAALGGITTMMRMLRLETSFKNSLPSQLLASSNSHYVDYTIHASIFNKQQIDEMKFCVENGISSFKLYMNLGGDVCHVYMDMPPNTNSLQEAQVEVNNEIIENVVKNAALLNCPVLVHAEDYESCACGIKTAKEKHKDGLDAWSNSRSPESEVKAIKTVSEFARKYNCTLYFVHVGSIPALQQIQNEKNNGTNIFVETCPHYLTLSCEDQEGYLAKVMPPIRTKNDISYVWNEIKNNNIDTIGTDHVANQLKLKLGGDDVWDALSGFPGLGTLLPILLSEGVNKNRISIEKLVQLTSTNASKIFGMYPKKGIITNGSDADIVLINLKKERTITNELFSGFSDYVVYEGWNLKGWPVKTFVRGQMVSDEMEILGKPGYGNMIKRPVT